MNLKNLTMMENTMITKIKLNNQDICVCFDTEKETVKERTLFGTITETKVNIDLRDVLVPSFMVKDEYLEQIKQLVKKEICNA